MAGTLTSAAPTGSPASHRAATVVALTVIAGTVMIPLDVTVVAVALARLSQETGAPLPVIQWVSTGYTLALAAVIPSAAWAIGRYGARRAFLGCPQPSGRSPGRPSWRRSRSGSCCRSG